MIRCRWRYSTACESSAVQSRTVASGKGADLVMWTGNGAPCIQHVLLEPNRTGRTSEVATEHEIENHEAIFVILECVAHVADVGVVDLLEEPSLLDDVVDRL
jgi:hypothetical protein